VFRHNCIRYEQDKRNRYGFPWKRQKALYLRRYAALSGFHKYFLEIAGAVCKEEIKITLLKILLNRCGFVDADKITKIKRFCQRIYINLCCGTTAKYIKSSSLSFIKLCRHPSGQ